MSEPVASPCIKVCVVDGQTGLCLGCARSLSEIGGWLKMDDTAKRGVIAQLEERKDTLRELGKLGPSS
jgi:predicted Fe-S protein YdhL (DUF1289 family)